MINLHSFIFINPILHTCGYGEAVPHERFSNQTSFPVDIPNGKGKAAIQNGCIVGRGKIQVWISYRKGKFTIQVYIGGKVGRISV